MAGWRSKDNLKRHKAILKRTKRVTNNSSVLLLLAADFISKVLSSTLGIP